MTREQEFIEYCRFVRNYTPSTIRNYENLFDIVQRWACDTSYSVLCMSQDDVLRFIRDKMRAGSKAATVNQYVSMISSFWRWAIRFHFDEYNFNPCDGIGRLKAEKDLPRCISADMMRTILADMPESSFKQLRSKAVILLAYHCGLRRSELQNAQLCDVDFAQCTIRVTGKGRKVRVVPLSTELVRILRLYLNAASQANLTTSSLFCTTSKNPLSYDEVAFIVRQALRRWVPESLCHCHILRHSFATSCMNAGVSIENIATLMGHESVNTTMRYLTISAQRIREQMKNVF